MACSDTIPARSVDVIRSSSAAISAARVGWYPTRDGNRPSRPETSMPACT